VSRQINLLPQQQAGPALSASRALIGLSVLLVGIVGYAAFAWIEAGRFSDGAMQANAQVEAEKSALRRLEQELAARPKLADIMTEIDALKPVANESQEMLALLRNSGTGSEAYSRQLRALAAASEDGVWLTAVKIGNSGKSVTIAGRALRNESVLHYAQSLNKQFVPFGVEFNSLEMTPDTVREGGSASSVSSVAFKIF
jgi:Tfp pilus assembly protein PilN